MSEEKRCKVCEKEMRFVAGGQKDANPNNTYMTSRCECGMEFTTEEIWTSRVDRALAIPVKQRAEETHEVLVDHFGSIGKYLRSMDEFKEAKDENLGI